MAGRKNPDNSGFDHRQCSRLQVRRKTTFFASLIISFKLLNIFRLDSQAPSEFYQPTSILHCKWLLIVLFSKFFINESDIFVEKDWIKAGKKYRYNLPYRRTNFGQKKRPDTLVGSKLGEK
jgi:hypothetical protein